MNKSYEYFSLETERQDIILDVSFVHQKFQLAHSHWLRLQGTDKVSTVITYNFRNTPVQQKLAILFL